MDNSSFDNYSESDKDIQKPKKTLENKLVFEKPSVNYPILTWRGAIYNSQEHVPKYRFDELKLADVLSYIENAKTELLSHFKPYVSQWKQDLYALSSEEEDKNFRYLTTTLTEAFVEELEEKQVFPDGFFELLGFPLLREVSYRRMEYDVIDGDYLSREELHGQAGEFAVSVQDIRELIQDLMRAHEAKTEKRILMDAGSRVVFLTALIAEEKQSVDDGEPDWQRVVVIRLLKMINNRLLESLAAEHSGEISGDEPPAFTGQYGTVEGAHNDEPWVQDADYWKNGGNNEEY